MNKSLETVLKEMCKMVNADFNSIDFKENNWYLKYSWNSKEENEFRKWFYNYLYYNKIARKELMRFPSKNKGGIDRMIDNFIFAYGWTFE